MKERITPKTPHYLPGKKTYQTEYGGVELLTTLESEMCTFPSISPSYGDTERPHVSGGLSGPLGMRQPTMGTEHLPAGGVCCTSLLTV